MRNEEGIFKAEGMVVQRTGGRRELGCWNCGVHAVEECKEPRGDC